MHSQPLRKTIAAIVLAAFCTIPVATTFLIERRQNVDALPLGTKLPPFKATFLDGSPFVRDSRNEKKLLLLYFTSQCSHCRSEIAHYDLLHEKYRNELDIVAVSLGTPESSEALKKDLRVNLPIVAGDSLMARLCKIGVVPSAFCIDEDQVLRCRSTGEHSLLDDEQFVTHFLALRRL